MKILTVDDSKAVHAFMKSIFKETSHVLVHAYDGQEALDVVESSNPDLILLDWEMPGLDGVQTLEALRSKKIIVPIIMVTSRNEVAQIVRALEKGANEYVMKPFTKDILFDKLEMVLGREVS